MYPLPEESCTVVMPTFFVTFLGKGILAREHCQADADTTSCVQDSGSNSPVSHVAEFFRGA